MTRPRKASPGLGAELKPELRPVLSGRLEMASWIEMPEAEFAREIEAVEKDPLFRKLHRGTAFQPGVIRRKRWDSGRFGGAFFEGAEAAVPDRQGVPVEALVGRRDALLPKIVAMGREAFERYFLYAEEALPLPELARRTGLSVEEAEEVNDLLLEFGSHAEFAGPAAEAPAASLSCVASVAIEDGAPILEFSSPYWARGRYLIRYDDLEDWKKGSQLAASELKRLPGLLRRLETLNLRQNTIHRVLESLLALHRDFLESRRPELMCPVSLRKLADRLELAPSTVSRAVAGRTLRLPWGEEVALIRLLPGRRRVLEELVSRWLAEDPGISDGAMVSRLKAERGITVCRRTVNIVRHRLAEGRR